MQNAIQKFTQNSIVFEKPGIFSDKKPGFLEIIEVYLNLGIGFWITSLVLPNYKTLVCKNQF